MQLNVKRINQMASGGSYVVIYDADVSFSCGAEISVSVAAAEPPNADPQLVEMAREAIMRGAERILAPLQRGAQIRVLRLVIHPTDFKPGWFERFTAWELQQLVGSDNG